jgi:hypothetical protein
MMIVKVIDSNILMAVIVSIVGIVGIYGMNMIQKG